MKPQPEKRNRKFHMKKGLRLQIYAWCSVVAVVMLVGITFAWYSLQKREAETEVTHVMKPYYLTLQNASETDALQLAVGSLQQGQTKQIVFCVSGKDGSKAENMINNAATTFAYALELIHTDNLALDYEIYPLVKKTEADAGASGIIVAEDNVSTKDDITGNNNSTTKTTYWSKKTATDGIVQPLIGIDVSAERWQQAGLITADAGAEDGTGTAQDIINRGTYISYESVVTVSSGDAETVVDNGLKLETGEGASITSQYFVLEISWKENIKDFSKYDKETDMIYILAKAVQPEPIRSTESP